MSPKLIILLYEYSKKPHYNMVSLITQSVPMDPKGSVIMRLGYLIVTVPDHSLVIYLLFAG